MRKKRPSVRGGGKAKSANGHGLPALASDRELRTHKSQNWFTRFAHTFARLAGKPATFLIALTCVVAWALSGPIFGYSDT